MSVLGLRIAFFSRGGYLLKIRRAGSFWLNTYGGYPRGQGAGVMRVLFCLRGHLWLEDKPRSRINS